MTTTQQADATDDVELRPLRDTAADLPHGPANSKLSSPKFSDKTHGSRSRSSKKRPYKRLLIWWPELLNALFVLTMLMGIVGLLYAHQNRPLPEWPYGITINASVAIFTTILKAASLSILSEGLSQLKWFWFRQSRPLVQLTYYDSASRGAMGSVRFIVKCSHDLLATAGAIIVLVSLVIDPVTQQLISYYNCPQVVPGLTASVPRANYYEEAGSHQGAGIWPLATPVYGVIDRGVFNPSDVKLAGQCSSGNCTLPAEYSTVGYCASCQDLSSQSVIQNITVPGNGWFINTTLPSGSYASFRPQGDQFQQWFTMNQTGNPYESGGSIEMIQAARWMPGQNVTDYFYESYPDSSSCTDSSMQDAWGCAPYAAGAATCSLLPCVRTYSNANISAGVLQEELIAMHTNMYVASTESLARWNMADSRCVKDPSQRAALRDLGFDFSDTGTMIPYSAVVDISIYSVGPANLTANNGPNSLPIINGSLLAAMPAECIYAIDVKPVFALTRYLNSYLNGAVRPSVNFDSSVGDPPLLAIWNNSALSIHTINTTFNAIADSITYRMRQVGLDYIGAHAQGQVLHTQTCIGVRWGFLAFPTAIVALTFAFLIATIVRAETGVNAGRAHGWKSSLLPLVNYSLISTKGEPPTTMETADIAVLQRQSKHCSVKMQ